MSGRVVFPLILVCVGCSEATPTVDVTRTDSAGVEIVANGPRRLAAIPEWHLSSSPSLEIQSTEEGEVVLFRVVGVTRTESGGVAVLNGGSNEVLLFDRHGQMVGRRGREGDGPGEFRALSSVIPLGGDSLAVYDGGHKRLSVFAPDGVLAREFTLDPMPEGSAYERLLPFPDHGFAVFTQGGLMGGSSGVFRSMSESFAVDANGERTGSFGRFPGSENFITQFAGTVLFGANSYAAVVGDELVVGTADEPVLKFYSQDDGLRRVVRWPDHDRAVSEERFEQYLSTAEAALPEAARPQARAMLAEVPRSERQPAYEDVLATRGGRLWVGDYRGPEMALPGARSPARSWLVLDKDGTLVARVPTPEGFQLFYVARDEVIGVFVDDLGVESIRVYGVDSGTE